MNLEDDLYREIILDHYKTKRNRGALEDADLHSEGFNPSCGDDLELFIKTDGDTIVEARYEGQGCSICCASANMLCDSIKGKSLTEARDISARFTAMLVSDGEADFPEELEDLEAMQGVKNYPVRIKCALLSWKTLEEMIGSAGRPGALTQGGE